MRAGLRTSLLKVILLSLAGLFLQWTQGLGSSALCPNDTEGWGKVIAIPQPTARSGDAAVSVLIDPKPRILGPDRAPNGLWFVNYSECQCVVVFTNDTPIKEGRKAKRWFVLDHDKPKCFKLREGYGRKSKFLSRFEYITYKSIDENNSSCVKECSPNRSVGPTALHDGTIIIFDPAMQ